MNVLMKTTTHSELTPERLMQLSWGYAPPLIIEAAVKHRLFDLLDAAPKNAQQLAKEAHVSLRGVTAICNALVGLRLLARDGGLYKLMPESATFLVSHKPAYHGEFFRHVSTQLIPRRLAQQVVRRARAARVAERLATTSEPFAACARSRWKPPARSRSKAAAGRSPRNCAIQAISPLSWCGSRR